MCAGVKSFSEIIMRKDKRPLSTNNLNIIKLETFSSGSLFAVDDESQKSD